MLASSNDSRPLVEALEKLRTRLVDAIHGYEEALKHADSNVAPALQRLRTEHSSHVEELGPVLARLNGETSAEGSWMTPVQETVMQIRAWLTGIDEGVVPAVVRGERSLLELYDEALALAGGDSRAWDTLTRQRSELSTQVAALEARRS